MLDYKKKTCNICGKVFNPISPNQKYCVSCKDAGRKLTNRLRDRKRYRRKYNYKECIKHCESCGKQFITYYSKKRFCGAEKCEKERLRRKNVMMQLKRSKESERVRYKKYYSRNKKLCKLRKALKYREINIVNKSYTTRIYKHDVDYVYNYVAEFGYKLLSKRYINNTSKIKLLCPEGHEWETNFHSFKDGGSRCLHCYLKNSYTSRPEQKLVDYFIENYPDIKFIHNDRKQITPLELDLYFLDQKIGVEVCGLYWHSEVSGGKQKIYHYNKMIKCYEKDIRLITVFEDEIRDKFEIVISRILQSLNLIPVKIYARKCEIREIDSKLANKFFRDNHVQGNTQPQKSWGLFYNHELVQVCSVGRIIRKHTSNDLTIELKRFCSKNNVSIIGGFSRLFKQVVKYCEINNYRFIKSYCDMRYGNIFNPVYEVMGFKLTGFTKYTPHYIKGGVRYRNFSLRKTPEERKTGKTEFELRLAQGYDRIWDCGHRTYVYEL